jgi:hypothetical protein
MNPMQRFDLTTAACALFVALTAISPGSLTAQGTPRWQEAGKTSTGNPVFVDTRSVRTDSAGIITATVRVTYTEPVATPQGPITGTRAVAMFDCAKKLVAVKESIIWHDEAKGTIYRKSAPKQPGFGPALRSTFAAVAMEYLCEESRR